MASAQEIVYALHEFEAENADEVSFKAGDAIIVVEKDDAYGDGWWQGTNEKGESGLFPFSYTTYDKALALGNKEAVASTNAAAAASAGGSSNNINNNANSAGAGLATGGPEVANASGVTADLDSAINELRLSSSSIQNSSSISGTIPGGLPASMFADSAGAQLEGFSKALGDGGEGPDAAAGGAEDTMSIGADTEEGADGDDEYRLRSAARAALAANAKKSLASAGAQERAEEERRKSAALKSFQDEERRQRELLLQKDKERSGGAGSAAASLAKKSTSVPFAGLEMSDESDSEGSLGDFADDLGADGSKSYSPLFGNQHAAQKKPLQIESQQQQQNGLSSLDREESLASAAATAAAAAAALPPPSNSNVILAQQGQQQRSLSPIPSASGHLSASTTGGSISRGSPQLGASKDEGEQAVGTLASVSSVEKYSSTNLPRKSSDGHSMRQRSGTFDSSARSATPGGGTGAGTGTGTTGTPATSVAGGTAVRPSGDPFEWNIEQVVEWARMKGWDEANVVSKFSEHEISGDVLLEMDANMLKEIDILAFGTRHKVAVAIRELKKSVQDEKAGVAAGVGIGRAPSPAYGAAATGAGMQRGSSFSQERGADGGSGGAQFDQPMLSSASLAGSQLLQQQYASSNSAAGNFGIGFPGSGSSQGMRAGVMMDSRNFSNATAPPLGVAGGFSPDMGAYNGGAVGGGMGGGGIGNDREVMSDDESASGLRKFGRKRRTVKSSEEQMISAPLGSPRKRESAGSRSVGAGERTSFFGIRPRSRHDTGGASGAGASSSAAGSRPFSRFVPKRLGAPNQPDLKSQISGPTGSPQYDAGGDTARRSRLSANSDGVLGSVGPTPGDWGQVPVSPTEVREGSVMSRIRPVDFEGWMKKKGERYNAWKPRYLALKGSDLVILRDPEADKIKGYISMKGYKLISDENVNPGKYGFKLLHEHEKPHYFSSEDPIIVRDWMKSLMKATIGRDHSFPVISSYNNATISLKEAQRMNPPPRPPSPTSRARTQKARARENPDQLTAKDAAVLMGLSSNQGLGGSQYR
ncbi:hypothetical protein K437DRAFT_259489 [Tilletiaria anomala UBC 951]|uniref:PH-domain-containing protein n=1 Tax=Tilletiaria anomala (strain ATCC 24038 / CBS 436.72 / UBC 951) TaxID=1037660 RepID=A0A066VHG9_TILAU|nr:uncharacterized protein K437DRAFT_259489 [Tilletiaria anomala UBC 951]KDN38199.1 hypothetical protein K437DRAFT_259489 [Tilletiaria anomala UBC 951]